MTSGASSKAIGTAAALISAAFFGLNAVASKRLYTDPAVFDAVGLFVARGVWSMPLFLGLALATRPKPMPSLTAKAVGLFLLCGLAYGPGTNALSALGAQATSASHAVLLLSLFPPLAALLAAIVLGEKISMFGISAVALGVIGTCILAFSRSGGGASLRGDALIAAFILTWAVLTLGIRKLDTQYPALFVVGVFGTIGAIMLGAIGVISGQLAAVMIPITHFDARTLIWFDLELVLFLSLAGQLLQGLALRSLNVAFVVALTSYGSIFAGMVASILLLGEQVSQGEIVAGMFLLGALALSLIARSRR